MIQFWYAATVLRRNSGSGGPGVRHSRTACTRRHFANINLPSLPEPAPKVSILKPVEGAGPNTYEALRRFAGWIIPAKWKSSSAPCARTIRWWRSSGGCRRNFPDVKSSLLFAELQGTNRKTSIMEAMRQKATGEFLFFSDADVAAPKIICSIWFPGWRNPALAASPACRAASRRAPLAAK